MICQYGCGKEATHQFKNGKWCCSKIPSMCSVLKKNLSKIKKGKPSHWAGIKRGPQTENHKKKIKEAKKGKIISWNKGLNKEIDKRVFKNSQKIGKKRLGKKYEELYGIEKARILKENHRARMLQGFASYMNKFIKNPSKPEVMLRNIVKELYPDCEFQHPVLRYSLDIAIPDKKIAIEYDGYYHFDTEEHKEYHKLRQEKIEKEGWKFLRYTMFDKFPTIEKIQNDILKLLRGK